ncbi:putative beta-galactosidase A [Apiospora saccharicola]|uniref:Beta-galactosidase n=1 Tax=Apiospora saccharicola TaxID=335842 RepID=A0ABR1TI49_9PEZI
MKLYLLKTALLALACATLPTVAGKPNAGMRDYSVINPHQGDTAIQEIVTWDGHSLFVNGTRVLILSGEFHPFRLPVPSLWLDVFQKVRALGFNTVSFYVDWALLEGNPGEFTAEGVFALEPFFEAAQKAGLWLIARPGPYINAEASGGGYPGWLQRVRGLLRTVAPDYLAVTDNYMANVCKKIAKAQITNGGPIILFQPENEYTWANDYIPFPDGAYMEYVMKQALDAGVVVPFISNDAAPLGHNAPGTGVGEVDIYGHDGYPLGFDCSNPTVWPADGLPTDWRALHLQQSPSTPYSINEFQAGSFDPWGGPGFEQCSQLVNQEFERVFYKNNFAAGVSILNLYMIFGGTNWGNLGHPGGYTSYDYGSVIKEDRTIAREKYSELKLEANFLMVSPGYLTATPAVNATHAYSDNADIIITPLLGNNTADGSFFVVRHTDYTSLASTQYRVTLPTSQGDMVIPQTNHSLTLSGRDSKVMVTDYDVQGIKLLYSTADVFTHQSLANGEKVLILYAGLNEFNEFAVKQSGSSFKVVEGGKRLSRFGSSPILGWQTSTERTTVQVGDLTVYLLDRNSAYKYWVTDVVGSQSKVIVNGPYLVRSVALNGSEISIQADFNVSTPVEIIGAPSGTKAVRINGKQTPFESSDQSLTMNITLSPQPINLPDLTTLGWKSVDSLPEVQLSYDDSAWTVADQTYTNNTYFPLRTTVSTYAADYGFNTGTLIYRGHFNATGSETSFNLYVQGGQGFASSVFLDGALLASWTGNGSAASNQETYLIPPGTLEPGTPHIFTVIVDNMGHDEQSVGVDYMKAPRGVLGWRLYSDTKATSTPVTWKLTGNLHGLAYIDKARGPLNEGGLFAERMGYHLPAAPLPSSSSSALPTSPLDGIPHPGVAFYAASFNLSLPADEWDIPLAFAFPGALSSANPNPFRLQLFVNGWQFGRLSSNIGPEWVFPVPEGILNYNGENWVGISLWALSEGGAKVPAMELRTTSVPIWTGRQKVVLVESPAWKEREGAY